MDDVRKRKKKKKKMRWGKAMILGGMWVLKFEKKYREKTRRFERESDKQREKWWK